MAINPGDKFKSAFGADIEVVRLLGEGGQGWVYQVKYNGQPKAIKLYKPGTLKDPKAFYKNLRSNIEKGGPSDAFLWPQDLLPYGGSTFGYVMDLRPEEYKELTQFLTAQVRFDNYKVLIKAALEIIAAFRILHNKGYSYQDLNDGNFFINPQTGQVLICDNDNVAPDGTHTGILGKPRYMAPEIVCGKNMPNVASDRFSLAVILFLMMTNTHPLEGKRYLVDPLTAAHERILYGTDPIFLLDPDDARNRPTPEFHKNIGIVWPVLPQYLKDMFLRAFSKDVMMKPGMRISEAEWQKVLIRFSGDILCCERCGEETFLTNGTTAAVCANSRCRHPFPSFRRLVLRGGQTEVLLSLDTIIYRQHFGVAKVEEAGKAILRVVKGQKGLMLRNVSGQILKCTAPNGTNKAVGDNEFMPILPGVRIRFGDCDAVIEI